MHQLKHKKTIFNIVFMKKMFYNENSKGFNKQNINRKVWSYYIMKNYSKKFFLVFFSLICFISLFSYRLEAKASYVLDTTSLVADIDYLSDEIENQSSFSDEYSNLISAIENSDMTTSLQTSFISIINSLKTSYEIFVQNINNLVDYSVASAFVYSALLVFQIYDFPLSIELLLKSWDGYTGVYTPVYGYIMNNHHVINSLVHHGGTGGAFSFDYNYSPINNGNDLFFAINVFSCSVSGVSVYVSDVYDFETNYTQYNDLFDTILNGFGHIMNAGYLSSYTINYTARHDTSYIYSDVNDIYHTKTCVCGHSINENHTWSNYTNSLYEPMYDPNRKVCRKCGRVKYIDIL